MSRIIALDSTPLGLLFQKPGFPKADECRSWMKRHLTSGTRIIVPEIINYELRRELLRLGRSTALAALASFNAAIPGRFLPINTRAMDLAADLWAKARRGGRPTADPLAFDIDVILAAQLLAEGLDPVDFVVATSNVAHLSQFVPAQLWETI
jgi:predicted nucleic acid-binding protein